MRVVSTLVDESGVYVRGFVVLCCMGVPVSARRKRALWLSAQTARAVPESGLRMVCACTHHQQTSSMIDD